MKFTTTTEIARKGSKIFNELDEAIVLANNKPIGALISYKIYDKLKTLGYLDEIIHSLDIDEKDYLLGLQKNLEEWNDEKHNNLFA